MLDPLSCLAIAGAVVQFLDFGSELVVEAHALCKNAASPIAAHGEQGLKDLKDFTTKFTAALAAEELQKSLTDDEIELQSLCVNCKDLADILTKKLSLMRGAKGAGVLRNIGTAVSNIWSKKEIVSVQVRLDEYRRAIDTRILSLLRSSVNAIAIQQNQRFNQLDKDTRQILLGLIELKSSLKDEIATQMMTAAQLMSRQELPVGYSAGSGSSIIVDAYGSSYMDPNTNEGIAITSFKVEESALRSAASTKVLKSLHFPVISDRFDEVSDAHSLTFNWIFRNSAESGPCKWDDFVEWLKRSTGIYWINGKAGSGKSTLMKFIFDHDLTQKYLKVWQGDMELYKASFFFWTIGSNLQKSQVGLLRSLLFQVLRDVPEVIPIIFPTQWAQLYMPRSRFRDVRSLAVLERSHTGFERLLTQTVVPMKVCFFVDGLDEYSGLGSELADLFQLAAQTSHVKICASSRPLPVFMDRFRTCPQMRLHDLTQKDIQNYVYALLEQNERMKKLALVSKGQVKSLVKEIVTSADGVFLWVTLVVRDLLGGLENHDDMQQLQERLHQLPTDLEALYEHMIFLVAKIYRVEAARFYQLVAATAEQKDDWRPAQPLTIFTLALAEQSDDRFTSSAPFNSMSQKVTEELVTEMDSKLRSRCGGLLEVQFGSSPRSQASPEMKVSYIHRTVKDYLDSTGIKHILSDRTGGVSADAFNPHVALMKGYIRQLQLLNANKRNARYAEQLVGSVITSARHAKGDTGQAQLKLMEIFIAIASTWWQDALSKPLLPPGEDLISVATLCGLHQVVKTVLKKQRLHPDRDLPRPLLGYVLDPDAAFNPFEPQVYNTPSAPTMMVLLNLGSDVNLKSSSKDQSPWQNAVSHLPSWKYQFNPDDDVLLSRWNEVLKPLLQHGADVSSLCWGHPHTIVDKYGHRTTESKLESPGEIIRRVYEDFPEVQEELEVLLGASSIPTYPSAPVTSSKMVGYPWKPDAAESLRKEAFMQPGLRRATALTFSDGSSLTDPKAATPPVSPKFKGFRHIRERLLRSEHK